jgi:hypothetical protein
MPHLQAVVSICVGELPGWVALPDGPWPDFVRFHGAATASDVALVMQTRSIHGLGASAITSRSAEAIVQENAPALPGGLLAVDGVRQAFPSCCSGVEDWRSWHALLTSGQPPWPGHDPSPFVEVLPEGFLVWPDGGLGEARPESSSAILFSREQLTSSLAAVEADLQDSLHPLSRWCQRHAPAVAEDLVRVFRETFCL